jgi:hypothetical protein
VFYTIAGQYIKVVLLYCYLPFVWKLLSNHGLSPFRGRLGVKTGVSSNHLFVRPEGFFVLSDVFVHRCRPMSCIALSIMCGPTMTAHGSLVPINKKSQS